MIYKNKMNDIYLDGSATTPPRIEVINRICEIQKSFWGNPSSIHSHGYKAAEILERSRKIMSVKLGAKTNDLIFTSGSTESIHLAIVGSTKCIEPGRIVISAVEHPSVNYAASILEKNGWELEYWPVDINGYIKLDKLDELLSKPTKFVSLIWGQGEVGTIQPIKEIGEACRSNNIIFHTDATQILAQDSINWCNLPVDLLSGSAHKFQGPKGIGFLLCNESIKQTLKPLYGGGGQEDGFRSGTEPVSLISGMALAMELLNSKLSNGDQKYSSEFKKVSYNTKRLRKKLEGLETIRFTGHPNKRLANHISMLVGESSNKPINGRSLVRELAKRGISASNETACKSGQLSDSQILSAMNIPKAWRQSGLRFTLGPWLRDEEIDLIPEILNDSILSLTSI